MATFFGGGGGTAAAGKGTQGGFQGFVSSFQGLSTKDSEAKEAAQPPTAKQQGGAPAPAPSTTASRAPATVVPFPEGSRPLPGATVPRAPLDLPVAEVRHSWGSSPGCEFNVRVGPNYKKFGKKEPSLPAFYDLVAFDFIRTQNVVDHVASFMAMEQVESEVEGDPPADVPRIFVVNCQLPEGEPPMFNAPEDGPGRSAVFFFSLKPEIAEALKDLSSAPPALKLMADWFRRAPNEPEVRGRFKVIATVKNMEELDLPGFISNYNGKPVLITKSGTLTRAAGYCEMDIRVHRFSYLAKKGLNFLQPKFPQMVFDVGFVVEARADDEMPEQMLGTARLFRLDYNLAPEVFRFA